MSNRIYYFMFENEYMDDLIKEIREIFSICDKKDEYILSDDKDYVYILNGKEVGKACILANRDTYVYTIYIFSNEKSSRTIERMLSELAEEIEDDYNDDRYRFVKPIDYDSEVLDYCIRMANKFNFFDLIDSYLNKNN